MAMNRVASAVVLVGILLLAACDPEGNLDAATSVSGGTERVRVIGWAWDPEAPGTPVRVRVVIDGVTRGSGTADRYRPDVAEVVPKAGTRTGFDLTVTTTAGTHEVCVVAENVTGTRGGDAVIGECEVVRVARSTLPRVLSAALLGASGPAPNSVALTWRISTPATSSPTCRIDWDGGGYDEVVANCDDLTARSHTYLTSGTRTVRLQVSDGVHTPLTLTRTATVAGSVTDGFDIERVPDDLDPAVAAAVDAGLARWEAVITSGLPDVSVPAELVDECSSDGTFGGGAVDDLVVDVSVSPIDETGNVLAFAGPCIWRTDGLPAYGIVVINSEVVDALLASGQLDDVVAHEVGHVLGIGTLWQSSVVGWGTSDPRYLGPFAWGRTNDPAGIAVENLGGIGSANSHWRESTHGDELMTSVLDAANPLSSISIGALADLGYRVDFSAAEAHPGTALRSAQEPLPLEEILLTPQFEI